MDYIAPSAECIKPTVLGKGAGRGALSGAAPERVKITLQDCLACSGCVTTAETVLITSQSKEEILRARSANMKKPWLVTVSTQSATALATYWGVSVPEAYRVISGFVRQVCKGAEGSPLYVCDLLWAQSISTRKTAEEFQRRVRQKEGLPLIVSACPGWVCYCRKARLRAAPLLCPVLSPQGIAGSYAKKVISPDVYHLSIQPCFDRKLEAARDSDANGNYYTDCVISTSELLNWMNEEAPKMDNAVTHAWNGELDSDLLPLYTSPTKLALSYPSSASESHLRSSDGYHLACIQNVANTDRTEPVEVAYEVGRKHNLMKAKTPLLPGQVLCLAYGFQQIQNIVRGLHKKLASVRDYTFIELMACPNGCLNGGGQIRYEGETEEQKGSTGEVYADFLTGLQNCSPKRPRAEERPFSRDALQNNMASLDDSWYVCTFRDRQKEFEQMMDEGNVHSLKW
ncbi:iron-containing hydrogenase [Angomonas deanei]|nr:iron-containing hydrogenase [Angomonas deanei]|eukprot:EPY30234.1 iron-containing hydrogenase [Angomonas deanei]